MNQGIRLAAAIGIVVMIVLLLLWGPPTASVERLRDTLQSYGPWAIVISAGLMIAQAVIAPIPGNVITITNGLVFGPFWGGLLSWISILIGSTLCFGISKLASTAFTKRIVGAPLERAESFFRRHGLQAVFLVRITPLVPFDAVSYAAGLVGVPFPKFILATAIGIIPSIIVYSYIGAVAVSAYWGLVGVLFLALLAVALVPRFLRKKSAPCAFPIQEPERTAAD